MSLQLILGSSGAGKSHYVYEKIIGESGKHPERQYLVLVPEQFTMQTQKKLVEMHPGGGILNIDVLSFQRLAYRVFEEVGGDRRKLLEETGKSLILQRIVQEQRENLPYLGSQMKKPGYIEEVKSVLSELMQYEVTPENLEELLADCGERPLLCRKLRDIGVLYQAFQEFLRDHYMTGEEVLDALTEVIGASEMIRGSVVVLDGYTGFTPIQLRVLGELMKLCRDIYVTVTMDPSEDPLAAGSPYSLFYMSRTMCRKLTALAREMRFPVEDLCWVQPHAKSRFAQNQPLAFLEQNLFRYRPGVYAGEQRAVRIYSAGNPRMEMERTAAKILALVREEGYRFGEICIVTGDLTEYAGTVRQVLESVGIPMFLDEKHSILMNPFVEYLRSALNMTVENYSCESVFRYLRCGMSDFTPEEIDSLENYCLALGIRGRKRWSEAWTRTPRGMDPAKIVELNGIRERFLREVEPLMEAFSGRERTVEEYTRDLYAFIQAGKIQEKLYRQEQSFHRQGNKAMEKEYHQIYRIVMELLDRMVEVLGSEKLRKQEYQQILETGLSQAKVALIPPSMDQVLVGDIERTRLQGVRALFFVGVNDGKIPKNTEKAGLLAEPDREFLQEKGTELAPGARELMAQQRFYLYLNMTKPSGKLFLSYSRANAKGEQLNPAYLIASVQKLFPGAEEAGEDELLFLQHPDSSLSFFLKGLREDGERDPLWRELYAWYLRDPAFREKIRTLVEAAFLSNPRDQISRSVAKALYGEISEYGATRLERYAACAFAHFLQYGLKLTEREEYEFRPMDLGNVVHMALEQFSMEVRRENRSWGALTEEEIDRYLDRVIPQVTGDYGNTILHSSARNAYLITRVRGMVRRTVWALARQLRNGKFEPEGFEVALEGGRIDRVDVYETEDRVYVKIIDYKTGSTKFDLVALYHGLQLQLVVYLNGALEAEAVRHPGKEIVPAGIFYYNVKDPMLRERIDGDLQAVEKSMARELKMNGLVQSEDNTAFLIDSTLETIPVSVKKDGTFGSGSQIADREQFRLLSAYVRKKIADSRQEILEGNAEVSPYRRESEQACTYCLYGSVCGFDRKIPGYEFRNLDSFRKREEQIWENMRKETP